MVLQGSRVTIRPLEQADLDAISAWRPFEDPLMADANWLQRPPDELRRWFAHLARRAQRMLYTILDESARPIGLLTLRDIKGRQSARLGITLGADFVNQGYGSEALALFLEHFFAVMGFSKMVLDVAAYNQRAIRVYRKLGFNTTGQRKRAPSRHMSLAFLNDPRYADLRPFFSRDWLGRWRVLYYEMELSHQAWKRKKETMTDTTLSDGMLEHRPQRETRAGEAAGETTPGQEEPVRWRAVATANGLAEAAIIQGRLESEGIPAQIHQEPAGVAIGLTLGLLGQAQVLVPEPLAEQAERILNEGVPPQPGGGRDEAR